MASSENLNFTTLLKWYWTLKTNPNQVFRYIHTSCDVKKRKSSKTNVPSLFLECFSTFISAFFYHLTFNICQVTVLTFSKLGQCQFKTFLRWILSRARKLIIRKWKKKCGRRKCCYSNHGSLVSPHWCLHKIIGTITCMLWPEK